MEIAFWKHALASHIEIRLADFDFTLAHDDAVTTDDGICNLIGAFDGIKRVNSADTRGIFLLEVFRLCKDFFFHVKFLMIFSLIRFRYEIRHKERSYGDKLQVTSSPTRILIEFCRIFPLIQALISFPT